MAGDAGGGRANQGPDTFRPSEAEQLGNVSVALFRAVEYPGHAF